MTKGPVDPRASQVIGVASLFCDNSFNAAVFAGMHRAARARGYKLLVYYGTPRVAAERGVGLHQIAGWIAMYSTDGLEELMSGGAPAVIFCAPAIDARCPVVRAENHDSTRRLVDHLVGLGRRRIAYIGKATSGDFVERAAAFDEALRARGHAPDLNLLSSFEECSIVYAERRLGELLDRDGAFCDAIVAGNDEMAIGAIRAIQARGLRVPEDIAVVGFDDISLAQHCDPPLTTMRQGPELLGRVAVDLLADLLDGRPPPQPVIRVPAELVVRRSCGSPAWDAGLLVPEALDAPGGDWQRDLSRRLNAVLEGTALSLPGERPLVWPEAEVVARGLGAALAGAAVPEVAELERAFDGAVACSDRIEVLLAVVRHIEETAARRLACAPGPGAAGAVATFLGRVRLAQQRALAASERNGARSLERLVRANMAMTGLLASRQVWTDERLGWLRQTAVRVGCLALWADDQGPAGPELVVDCVHTRTGDPRVASLVGRRCGTGLFPPPELFEAASPDEAGGHVVLVPIAGAQRDWGTLVLGGLYTESFADNLQPLAMWVSLLVAAFEHHHMKAALHAERDMLAAAYERERALSSTVRELGCPVIPLLPGVLLVSLIGAIDAARAQQITESVLSGVAREGARWVLLDVTGVPVVEAETAAALVETAQATRLLGARVSLVGVGPAMAQRMVGLGIELEGISIFQSLAAAIRQLTRRRPR